MDEKHLNDWLKKRKQRREETNSTSLKDGLINGNITSLSKAITLLESTRKDDILSASELIKSCMSHSGKSIRIGITGVPGAGKSTFIEAFGKGIFIFPVAFFQFGWLIKEGE